MAFNNDELLWVKVQGIKNNLPISKVKYVLEEFINQIVMSECGFEPILDYDLYKAEKRRGEYEAKFRLTNNYFTAAFLYYQLMPYTFRRNNEIIFTTDTNIDSYMRQVTLEPPTFPFFYQYQIFTGNLVEAKCVILEKPSTFLLQLIEPNVKYDFLSISEILNKEMETDISVVTECDIGQLCVAKSFSDNKWYRARIIAPISRNSREIFSRVKLIDIGEIEWLHKCRLRNPPKSIKSNVYR